jgi:hypothetical protein
MRCRREAAMSNRGSTKVTVAFVLSAVLLVLMGLSGARASSSREGIVSTSVDLYPDNLRTEGIDAIRAEMRQRLVAWEAEVGIDRLSAAQLEDGVDALTEAINTRPQTFDFLSLQELQIRRDLLCQRLPEGHPYGEGEYCSATSSPSFLATP